MAQEQAAAKKPEAPKPPGDGWESGSRPDIDGWVKAVPGLVVYGKVEGFFGYEIDGQAREAVCLRIIGDKVKAQLKGGAEKVLEQGQIIAVSMNHGLEGMRPYLSKFQEGSTYAWIHYKAKESIGGGRSVWKIDLKMKGPKGDAARATKIASGDGGGVTDDGEVPF